MNLFTNIAAVTILVASGASAQNVTKCCGTNSSYFHLGTLNAAHTQFIYPPGSLANPQSGTITDLYLRYGEFGAASGNTLTGFTMSMGQTTATTFVDGNMFFSGLEVVLTAPTYSLPGGGSTGGWYHIALQTPFVFDHTRTLIFGTRFTGSSNTTFSTMGSISPGRKLSTGDLMSATGSTSSSNWADIGLEVIVGTGLPESHEAGFRLLPNADYSTWQLFTEQLIPAGSTVQLLDATGRVLSAQRTSSGSPACTIESVGMSSGVYLVRIQLPDGSMRTRRIMMP